MSRGRSDGELIEGGKRTEQKNNEESWSALFSYASFPRQCLVIDCPSRHSRLSDHDDRLYVLVSGKGEEGKCDEAKGVVWFEKDFQVARRWRVERGVGHFSLNCDDCLIKLGLEVRVRDEKRCERMNVTTLCRRCRLRGDALYYKADSPSPFPVPLEIARTPNPKI